MYFPFIVFFDKTTSSTCVSKNSLNAIILKPSSSKISPFSISNDELLIFNVILLMLLALYQTIINANTRQHKKPRKQ